MTDLATLITEAIREDGLVKLTLRVNRYGPDGVTPEAWCCQTEYAKGSGRRGTAIRSQPLVTVERALEDGARRDKPEEDMSFLTTDTKGIFA
jgi:hypothetical protein